MFNAMLMVNTHQEWNNVKAISFIDQFNYCTDNLASSNFSYF